MMDSFVWNDEYAIGVALIDYQHRKLFELVNLFIEAVKSIKCQQLVGPMLMGLVTYTKSHFAAEEAEMLKAGYPELEGHRGLHEQLVAQVEAMVGRWRGGESVQSIGLVDVLTVWLRQHVQVEDRKIGVFLARQKAGACVQAAGSHKD